jgi:prepilin-type N-terminal cleavage/methylation domain-containing protein
VSEETCMSGHPNLHQPDRSKDRGFTLVEILIAIVLVGILSAVVVVGIGNLTSQGSSAACDASADAARTATTIHFTNTGQQPETLQVMVDNNELELPSGVTIDASGLIASGDGWTLTMEPGPVARFICSDGAAAGLTVTGGLVVRLDATNRNSMFQDADGLVPTTAAGQMVCRWADRSGSNTHALQTTPSR